MTTHSDVPAEVFFGGTFDPIHIGHLFVAEEARAAVGAMSVLFVPAGRNPLKDDPSGASPEARLHMTRLAIRGNGAFRVSSAEIERGGPSYTVDTVETLVASGELRPRPGLIVGDDLIAQLPRWKDPQRLFAAVRLIVVTRHVTEVERLSEVVPTDTLVIRNPAIPVSSSDVRERLRDHRSVRYLVPDAVYEYIRFHSLYR
ncbi:MAG: nicotinate-nucleotide adenylyltransferase [Spirochaetales bacterium]|nr:nicotinate-nucleotide adenylyltransferase [Spirochaetales bacterium]